MKRLLLEISPIIIFVIACVLAVIMLPIGFVYTVLIKPIQDYKGRGFRRVSVDVLRWIGQVFYQLWRTLRLVFHYTSYIIDLLGNVLVGRILEKRYIKEEFYGKHETLFGRGDVTISAALGEIQKYEKINNKGLKMVKILDWFDKKRDNHCLSAYELYIFKTSQT